MINLMDDEAESPREKRYQGGYTPVQDPLLPDVEPSSDSRKVGFADDDGVEMRLPNPRERSQSTVSNISEHGKEHGPQQEKPMVMGYNILILLFILGITTSVLNGCAQWANKLISQAQSQVLESNAAGPFLLMLTTAGFVALSSFVVWKGNIPATIGSGMPEVKATLVNDFHRSDFPSIVSFKILCIRLVSLVSAAGSGLSVGIAAPLVHISICLSYVLMNKIPDFGEFLENHAIRKQVFAAAAAVGMSTVFNAPIGGLLLSIELTSTFYLISNYWRSFMVATTGAVWYSVFQLARSEEGQIFSVPIVEKPFLQWEFAMFAILGLICGGLGLNYLKLHQAFFLFVKPYTLKYPISTAASAGALTALLIYAAGAHSAKGVSESIIVHDVFQDCNISEMNSRHNVSPLGGLFASLIVRIFLTLIGTTLRISCGVFLPVLTLGALGGRIFGQILAYMCGNSVNIYVAGYAMVGAVGFVSATTHTISVAVIVIEQTGQFSMLLPCLLAAVVACGITKSRSLSLYDQGMINKGLESFELLMKDKSGHRYAADVMDEKVISVSEKCTVQDLFSLLSNLRQSTFPVTSGSGRLVGCIERVDVFAFLKSVFEKENLYGYMRDTVSADVHVEDRRLDRLQQIETRNALLQGLNGNGKSQEYDEDGHPVSHFKGVFGMLGRTNDSLAGIHRVDSGDEMEGFSASGALPTEGTHEGPSAMSPLHTPPPPPSAPKVAPPSPQTDRAVNKTPFKSSKSEDSLLTIDNMVKRFSHRIASFGAGHGGDAQGSGVRDALTQLRVDNLLAQNVDLAQEPLLPINGFPFTAHRFTTMDQLYVLFEMVKVQCVFVVTNTKRLEGMISKNLLMQTLKKKRN